MEYVVNHHWLVHVKLEVSLAAPDGDGGVVPHDLAADHCHGL